MRLRAESVAAERLQAGRRHLTTTKPGLAAFRAGLPATSMRLLVSTVTGAEYPCSTQTTARGSIGESQGRAGARAEDPAGTELERKRAPGADDAPGDTAEDAAGDIDLEHMALFGCGRRT